MKEYRNIRLDSDDSVKTRAEMFTETGEDGEGSPSDAFVDDGDEELLFDEDDASGGTAGDEPETEETGNEPETEETGNEPVTEETGDTANETEPTEE